jgi:hypothetical protein
MVVAFRRTNCGNGAEPLLYPWGLVEQRLASLTSPRVRALLSEVEGPGMTVAMSRT